MHASSLQSVEEAVPSNSCSLHMEPCVGAAGGAGLQIFCGFGWPLEREVMANPEEYSSSLILLVQWLIYHEPVPC